MTQIQDRLKVLSGSAVIAGEESGLAAKSFFSSMARWQKVVFFAGLILIVPAYFAAYYGSQMVVSSRYEKDLLQPHAAFAQAKPLSATSVTVLKVNESQYAAYFQVTNNNLDLAAPSIPYTLDFFNTAGEKIYSSPGTFFLLPDQKKYVITPRIESREEITSAKLTITEVKWQKRLAIPRVSFKTPTPEISDQLINPSQLVVEGSVVNDSPYTVKAIKISFLVYDRSGHVVGVSSRDEGNLVPFGRRAYKQNWPGLSATDIAKVEVSVDVNTLDPSNLIFSSSQAVPAADSPDLN
jgi:hypothetical protein